MFVPKIENVYYKHGRHGQYLDRYSELSDAGHSQYLASVKFLNCDH